MSWRYNLKGESRSEIAKKYGFGKHMLYKKLPEEVKNKISMIAKKKGFGKWMIGKHLSEEHRRNISLSNLGKTSSEETRLKISLAKKGKRVSINSEFKSREKHPNWLGGKSFEPYGLKFDDVFKQAIYLRDNFSCIICGSDNRLAVHHIDYNKLNTCKENCISVCCSCHAKTNFNREHWIKFFKSYLFEHYKYPIVEVIKNE